MLVTLEVVAFVLGATTGTGAEAGLTAGTAVVARFATVSVRREAPEGGARQLAV